MNITYNTLSPHVFEEKYMIKVYKKFIEGIKFRYLQTMLFHVIVNLILSLVLLYIISF